jgi:hypothetical protein
MDKEVLKSTKEGALYLDVNQFFTQSDVKILVERLQNSNLRSRIRQQRQTENYTETKGNQVEPLNAI